MNKRIWLSSPNMGGQEQSFVNEAFAENWIAPLGPNVNGFEEELCSFTGAKHAAALSSGTAAIHLGLIILGVERGDEVICSSFTFSASANPICYQGATPVFVDSEADTWNMDPSLLRQAIETRLKETGKKPKAIILVHLYGVSAKLEELMAIAREYDIPVIEDAAEALGSTYKGQALGTFGDIGVYSFNGNKIITTSGGGMMVSDNQVYVEKARFLATQARDNAPHYQHSEVGYNYRMSNVCAGIGRGQLLVLEQRVEQKRTINDFYRALFNGVPGITFLNEGKDCYANYWLTSIVINEKSAGFSREDLRLALAEDNIEARPLWKPMHLQPVFEKYPSFTNGTSASLFDDGLCLPSDTNMNDEDLERIKVIVTRLLQTTKNKV